MSSHVINDVRLLPKRFIAHRAGKWFDIIVHISMVFQHGRCTKRLWTHITFVDALISVRSDVLP